MGLDFHPAFEGAPLEESGGVETDALGEVLHADLLRPIPQGAGEHPVPGEVRQSLDCLEDFGFFLRTCFLEHMSNWAALYADDPVMRNRLIDFAKSTSNPKDYAELNAGLLQRWPQEDAMGMMSYLQELQSYLESDAVPAAARPQVDASAVGVAIFREYDGPALKWWMERYGDSRETPAPMKSAMADWMKKYPDKAMQWFQEQPAGLQRDSLTSSVIPALITMKRFDDAARSIENIQDPVFRQNSAQRLNILWSEQDPAAAKTWRENLPAGTIPE